MIYLVKIFAVIFLFYSKYIVEFCAAGSFLWPPASELLGYDSQNKILQGTKAILSKHKLSKSIVERLVAEWILEAFYLLGPFDGIGYLRLWNYIAKFIILFCILKVNHTFIVK